MDKLSRELVERDKRVRVNKDTESVRIQKAVEKTVLTIFDRVKAIDNRLSLKLRKVGSYYDGLKIGLPDEFDFLAELDNLKEGEDVIVRPTGFRGTRNLWKTPKGKAGRRKLQYIGSSLHDVNDKDPTEAWLKQIGTKKNPEYVMDCISVKNTFYYAVLDVVRALTKEDLPRYLTVGTEPTFMHEPAVTLEFIWNGRAYKNLIISVDLTICIRLNNWKMTGDIIKWMHEDSCLWKPVRHALDNYGYHLIPYISDRGHSCQWRISTPYMEHLLMASFHYDAKFKIAIRCLKHQRDQLIDRLPETDQMVDQRFANVVHFQRFYSGDDPEKQLLSSYVIKTTALVTLGLLSRKELNSIPVLYCYLVVRLYSVIEFDQLMMFFISNYKLNIPEFGDVIPGFKALVDSINEEDIPKFRYDKTDSEQFNDEYLELAYTYDSFKLVKHRVNAYYDIFWASHDALTFKPMRFPAIIGI